MISRRVSGGVALGIFALLLAGAMMAPEHLAQGDPALAYASPADLPPLGADQRGRPLWEYAAQGASVVLLPSMLAGLVVAALGVLGGLLRCTGSERVNSVIQGLAEVMGALPRMVVILVVALVLPADLRGLTPLALAWALLASPGAADEAAAVAERLGGARFVEALRAHGFGLARIYLLHVVAYNLRPVVVRQGAETMMHVVFLEIALSYLALAEDQPSFTHLDSLRSWADLLQMGYHAVVLDVPSMHALILGLGLLGLVTAMSMALGHAARAR